MDLGKVAQTACKLRHMHQTMQYEMFVRIKTAKGQKICWFVIEAIITGHQIECEDLLQLKIMKEIIYLKAFCFCEET